MYPASFEYLAPSGVGEAVALLQQHGEDAKLLAGGQSLVPMMKLRVARPKYVIDINRIAELNFIRASSGELHCGALIRHAQIEDSSLVREKIPLLCEAAGKIGDAQVRNRGTLVGGLAEADPAGDWGPVALALNARMKCAGPRGERLIAAQDFFTFAYTAALHTDEIVTEVIFPVPDPESAGAYLKLEHVAGDFAIASAAVQIALDGDDVCRSIGIGVTGAAAVPRKPAALEKLLQGQRITPELIDAVGRLIQESAEPLEDTRGSAAYKKKALGAVLKRALREALRRADARKPS